MSKNILKGKDEKIHTDAPNLDKRITRKRNGSGIERYGDHITQPFVSNANRDPTSTQNKNKLLQK